eukprot:537174-Amphidinium_carterae.4
MAYVDNLLVVGDSATTQPFLQQFQQHLELKHTSQPTVTTPLEFLGKTIELQEDGTILLSFAQQYCNKILRMYNMDYDGHVQSSYKTRQQEITNCSTTIGQKATLKVQDSGTITMGLTITSGHCFRSEGALQITTTTRQ